MLDRLWAWYDSTFGYALTGAVLLWLSLPPADLWPLAWVAPIWWLLLIRRQTLGGRRPYLTLFLVGFLFWMAAYYWLWLPNWGTAAGWPLLAFYHAFYLPAFIALARVGVHGVRLPLCVAAAVVWVGLELARAHLLTGITMASFGHTQYRWIELIQISDLGGVYAVSFVVMFAAGCVAQMLPLEGSRGSAWPLVPFVAVLGLTLAYGLVRQGAPSDKPLATIGLIQGSIDVDFFSTEDIGPKAFKQYFELSREAVEKHPEIELIVWPECMLGYPLGLVDDDAVPIGGNPQSPEEFRKEGKKWAAESWKLVGDLARALQRPIIVSAGLYHYRKDGLQQYNTALHVDHDGELLGRYDKMHLVPFGEYAPLVDWFPALKPFNPLPSTSAGQRAATFVHGNLVLSPSICYENVISHVIRGQVQEGTIDGRQPDVLVNMSNDGWFWGSAELKMHFVCGVFRAVECRKPCLIAANTGISAFIDGDGRVVQQGPRREKAILVVPVQPDGRMSPYLYYGDWPAAACLLATVFFGFVGGLAMLRKRSAQSHIDIRLTD